LIGNSGNFISTTPLLWEVGISPFAEFMSLCDWIYERLGRKHSIPLVELGDQIFAFLTQQKGLSSQPVAEALLTDYQRAGRDDVPLYLRDYFPQTTSSRRDRSRALGPKRQGRHLGQAA
jgi:hypothetical protein